MKYMTVNCDHLSDRQAYWVIEPKFEAEQWRISEDESGVWKLHVPRFPQLDNVELKARNFRDAVTEAFLKLDLKNGERG